MSSDAKRIIWGVIAATTISVTGCSSIADPGSPIASPDPDSRESVPSVIIDGKSMDLAGPNPAFQCHHTAALDMVGWATYPDDPEHANGVKAFIDPDGHVFKFSIGFTDPNGHWGWAANDDLANSGSVSITRHVGDSYTFAGTARLLGAGTSAEYGQGGALHRVEATVNCPTMTVPDWPITPGR